MRLRLAAAAIAAALPLAGCDGEEAPELESAENPAVALAERIPEAPVAGVAAVDLAAARGALGLPADANPATAFPDGTEEELRLWEVAGSAIPHLARPAEVPIAAAIDEGQVTAAASSTFAGSEAVTVLATEQPFDEIAASLEDAGYRQEGEVLETRESGTEVVHTIVAGGDDVIAMGGDLELVSSAAEGETPSPSGADRELLARLGGAPAIIAAGAEGSCVDAYGVADEIEEGRGELAILVGGGPSPDRFTSDQIGAEADLSFGEPVADGEVLTVPFTQPVPAFGSPFELLAPPNVRPEQVYDCA